MKILTGLWFNDRGLNNLFSVFIQLYMSMIHYNISKRKRYYCKMFASWSELFANFEGFSQMNNSEQWIR